MARPGRAAAGGRGRLQGQATVRNSGVAAEKKGLGKSRVQARFMASEMMYLGHWR